PHAPGCCDVSHASPLLLKNYLNSVVEELQLNRELIAVVACAQVGVRVSGFGVEVVTVREPREADLLTIVVAALSGGSVEILFLVADPRHDFRSGQVVARLDGEVVLL